MKLPDFSLHKGRQPTREFKCPACGVAFVAGGTIKDGRTGKTCPAGHWHTVSHLTFFEIHGCLPQDRVKIPKEPMIAVVKPVPVNQKARVVGFTGDRDRYHLAAASMLAGFDQVMQTLPVGSVARGMVEGAFGKAPEIARQILEAP